MKYYRAAYRPPHLQTPSQRHFPSFSLDREYLYRMVSLLSVPREIRDNIIDEVLRSQSLSGQIAVQNSTGSHRKQSSGLVGTITHYHKLYTAYGLLLTNWQLHTETSERLSSVPDPELDLRVDTVGDGFAILPRWKNLAVRRSQLDTIRIILDLGPCGNNMRSFFALTRGEGIRDATLCYPLETCMQSSCIRRDVDKHRLVKELRLNIITGPKFPKPNDVAVLRNMDFLGQGPDEQRKEFVDWIGDFEGRMWDRVIKDHEYGRTDADLYAALVSVIASRLETFWNFLELNGFMKNGSQRIGAMSYSLDGTQIHKPKRFYHFGMNWGRLGDLF
ncbi:hypothetical protein BS50DRAFT_401895 [Corynespora cassiicola Philippines]|uniref:Uncharacterized protein n=1 Tax=Corynespora cassiicola Philippines TaxID=1448308 RepID=A0A2T2NKJ2_CORCC|nr:hypothetical protein BS50DRAFT_401895 [Corynespora cassiicola Philippines]